MSDSVLAVFQNRECLGAVIRASSATLKLHPRQSHSNPEKVLSHPPAPNLSGSIRPSTTVPSPSQKFDGSSNGNIKNESVETPHEPIVYPKSSKYRGALKFGATLPTAIRIFWHHGNVKLRKGLE
jgi:hypothetical protein